jgi:hypothetical protein
MTNSSITYENPSHAPARSEASPVARAFLTLITLYRRLTAGRVSACRFYPSCSAYAAEAVETHGACAGAHTRFADSLVVVHWVPTVWTWSPLRKKLGVLSDEVLCPPRWRGFPADL